MNYSREEILEHLASHYSVGAMSARVRRRFERLRKTLPAAERAAQSWERRLAPLSASVPTVEPPRAVWQAIERRIGAAPASRAASGWKMWFLPALGFAFGVAVTAGLVRLYPAQVAPAGGTLSQRDVIPASYVGLLTDGEGAPIVLASSTRFGRQLSIKFLKPFAPPPGKLMQLWALPKDGAPIRIGTIPPGQKVSLTLADTSERLFANVTLLAVSLEDASGNAVASPSPFVLAGHCVKLW